MRARTRVPLTPIAYSVPDAALVLGLGEPTIWKAISTGELAAVKIGKRTLVKADDLDAFLDRHRQDPAVDPDGVLGVVL